MNKRTLRGLIASTSAAISILAVTLTDTTVTLANSMPTEWSGSPAFELEVMEDNCPIEVVSETLTLDLQEFPKDIYQTQDDYLAYSGNVTASYEFYNPTDYAISATLAFPFGSSPDYAYTEEGDNPTVYVDDYQDVRKYDITVDGTEVGKEIRCTLDKEMAFEAGTERAKLIDGYVDDVLFKPDMQVIKYTYKISEIGKYEDVDVYIDLMYNVNATVVLTNQYDVLEAEIDGYRIGNSVKDNETIIIYVIGEGLKEEPSVTTCVYGDTSREITDAVVEMHIEELTFKEMACRYYDAESGISESDWYNAVVSYMNYMIEIGNNVYIEEYLNVSGMLMRWYTYEISIEPGQKIINEVTAPIYPNCNYDYEPHVYEYQYLLSPASQWSSFGEFEVIINTPFYIQESSIGEFEKTEYGYTYKQSGLPNGEFEFSLCEVENPDEVWSVWDIIENVAKVVGVVLVSLPIIGIVTAIIVNVHRKMKKIL